MDSHLPKPGVTRTNRALGCGGVGVDTAPRTGPIPEISGSTLRVPTGVMSVFWPYVSPVQVPAKEITPLERGCIATGKLAPVLAVLEAVQVP